MWLLNDENKLQVDEKNSKNWKLQKIFENEYYHKLRYKLTVRYKLTALSIKIHLISNNKLMRLVIFLRQLKE